MAEEMIKFITVKDRDDYDGASPELNPDQPEVVRAFVLNAKHPDQTLCVLLNSDKSKRTHLAELLAQYLKERVDQNGEAVQRLRDAQGTGLYGGRGAQPSDVCELLRQQAHFVKMMGTINGGAYNGPPHSHFQKLETDVRCIMEMCKFIARVPTAAESLIRSCKIDNPGAWGLPDAAEPPSKRARTE